MKIRLILATDLNGGIGYNNKLLAKLPIDMDRFVQLTTNHRILMGKNTALSLKKPLKNRKNLVVTQDSIKGFDCYKNIEEAINSENSDLWIIGGAKLYNTFLETGNYDEIYLTLINNEFENCDSFVYLEKIKNCKLIYQNNYIDNNYNCNYMIYKK